ncbi:hypothetical protein FIBSPDRAFT_178358 [Athelia psychrophila]|uniref:Uncharacterized protein n=1 Tax=Athelia psychrophila TaxID=1759441 RepID=A0A166SQM1_9AGAM|nr:hypothetical protein FIBSPDRAFT_178358 [Fibularhizoctonia sp. CBS 109695]
MMPHFVTGRAQGQLLTPTPILSPLSIPRIRARLHVHHRFSHRRRLGMIIFIRSANHRPAKVELAMRTAGLCMRMRIVKIVQMKMLLGGKVGA